MRKIKMSFQLRLYLYILFLIVIIFGSIAVVFDNYSCRREESQASLYTFALQNTTILNLEDELEWMESTVEITVRHVLASPEGERENAMDFIGQLIQNNSLILGVGYINFNAAKVDYAYEDDSGKILYNRVPIDKYNYTQAQWYTSAVKEGKGEWTEPYVDKTGSRKTIVSYALPIKDKSEDIIGVIVVDVALKDLTEELGEVQPFKDSYTFIVSRKGTVITHPNTKYILKEDIFSLAKVLKDDDYDTLGKKMLAGETGSMRCELDSTDVLVCYAPMKDSGWFVVSVCPYSAIVSELGSVTFTILAILVVGIIILLVCIHFLLSRMMRPVQQMTDTAYLISKGDFDASLPDVATHDDFGKLHDAFLHMQQSLKTYMANLESETKARERINGELKVANSIQMDILPIDFVLPQGYENIDIDAFLTPAREVGGDFYDFYMKDGKIFFTIGDVSGKGIAAAIVMSMTCTLFRSLHTQNFTPSRIMNIINETLSRNNKAEMFVTMFIGIFDTATGELTYCNAGHNAPYVFSAEEGCAKLPVKPKLPLALFNAVKYEDQTFTLKRKQSLLLYTDGLTEAENRDKEQFGTQRLETLLANLSDVTSHEILRMIKNNLETFVDGAEQSDDLTLFALSYDNCRTLILDNRMEEMAKLQPFIKGIGDDLKLEKSVVLQLMLAIEEALVNVINYAYPEKGEGKINLKAIYKKGVSTLRFELTDSGKPFDPTKAKDADLTLGVEERPVGGLGIFLIKKRMDEVIYKRENDMNKLIMIKNIGK